ncbi:hypothetical protein SUGI_0010180 [Cryptomeria japonica]|uniref:uncharacterized protein LOC131041982 n=1 Tax=Cryptomeria japonica TaxID=3369 RepID=UPI002408DCA5|nr:uncharacterized protein LOC131041982 [Cryptomeria japonica]GLJ05053.1 hypothetical protein SUGI_0010180 [Cryptomeria japonica]
MAVVPQPMKLLFVQMGTGYDQHGQDITMAAMRACKDAICKNCIPAFGGGTLPGINQEYMKLKLKLGVPRFTKNSLDLEQVKAVFPYGEVREIEVVEGGLVCSTGEYVGEKPDDCYVVNAAVYVGY